MMCTLGTESERFDHLLKLFLMLVFIRILLYNVQIYKFIINSSIYNEN